MRSVLPVLLLAAVTVLTGRAWAYEQANVLTEREDGRLSEVARTVKARSALSRSVSTQALVGRGPSAAPRLDTSAVAPDLKPASRSTSTTASWPTREAMRWRAPRGWLRGAFCIHRHESVDWYRAYVDWRGYPSDYSGGMQFTLSTWRRAGGSGHPHQWRPREQVYRAWRIWRLYRNESRPGSWTEWGTAGRCGLA